MMLITAAIAVPFTFLKIVLLGSIVGLGLASGLISLAPPFGYLLCIRWVSSNGLFTHNPIGRLVSFPTELLGSHTQKR